MEPIFEYNPYGDKIWHIPEKRFSHNWLFYHRLNGPAIEFNNGDNYYWVNYIEYNNFIEYIQAVIEYKRKYNL